MRHTFIFIILIAVSVVNALAQTDYSFDECLGSARPYVEPKGKIVVPDTLQYVMVNHVGRHGARYPSSGKNAMMVRDILNKAVKARTITPHGRKLLALTNEIIDLSTGRWGALDTLGKAEQRWLAARMGAAFPKLFEHGRVNAISSYVPRCIMSMYEFAHQLTRQNNRVEIYTSSGRQNNDLMRFFDESKPYKEFEKSSEVHNLISEYADSVIPEGLLAKYTGKSAETEDIDETDALMAIYSVLAGTAAMELNCNIADYMSREDFNALWSVFNFRQYLTHSASAISDLPADISKPLLLDLVATTDSFISGADTTPVQLRFGHAETLMPLLALIQIPDCRYTGSDIYQVADNWKDFDIVPMAANFRLVLFKSDSGNYYVRADLNERPVSLYPGAEMYMPWEEARSYLLLRAGQF